MSFDFLLWTCYDIHVSRTCIFFVFAFLFFRCVWPLCLAFGSVFDHTMMHICKNRVIWSMGLKLVLYNTWWHSIGNIFEKCHGCVYCIVNVSYPCSEHCLMHFFVCILSKFTTCIYSRVRFSEMWVWDLRHDAGTGISWLDHELHERTLSEQIISKTVN